jgi:hypothetical protein
MLSIHYVIFVTFLAMACLFPQAAYSTMLENKQDVMPTEGAFKKATDDEVKLVTSDAAADAVDDAVEKAVQKSAEQETVKQEVKASRPDERKGPTKVIYRVFILDIDEIDDANQNFTANVFLELEWKDERHANPEGDVRRIQLDEIWNPGVLLANQQGLVSRSLPETVQVHPDGTVYYRQRYTGKLSQPLKLDEFPMDKHWFKIQFVSADYRAEELEFVPGASKNDPSIIGGAIANELSLPDWKILRYETYGASYQPIDEVRQAGFLFKFEADRYIAYYLWQMLLPLTMVVVMSWAGFWVQRGQVGVRIGIATSSILTLIAHRFVLASLLPRLPYMTRLDYFTVACTLLVFLALIGVVTTSYLSSINRDMLAKNIDQFARPAFPVAFVALIIWFMKY